MIDTYAMAYTEVLEILKYLPKEEYDRIPKEKIEFYENNKDNNYTYVFDASKALNEQNISRKTNAIIVSLFRDYFATSVQKERLNIILKQNEEKHQTELREKYNPDNIFNKNTIVNTEQTENGNSENNNSENNNSENMMIVVGKDSIFKRIISWVKKIFNNR